MIFVTKKFTFESAHFLPNYLGACHHMHGHSYELQVTVCGEPIEDRTSPKYGMILDFKELKKIVKENVVDNLDHSLLNDWFDYPTAEVMVKEIGKQIEKFLPKNVHLVSTKLYETKDSYATYLSPSFLSLVKGGLR